jgi:hypothetical protein
LRQDLAMVQRFRHLVHCGAGKFATCINGTLVRMEPCERGQQGWVNVDQAAGVMRHKSWRQNSHEASQDNQVRRMHINFLRQRLVKRFA